MPFELRDFQGLLRLLREHPDWREELRALLLSQELLTLPALVRELAETVAQLAVRLGQLTARVVQLAEGQERLSETVARLAEGQERFVVQMGEVRGWALEQHYHTHAPAYFGRFLRRVQLVDVGRLADALKERLAEGELAEVLLADLILSGCLSTSGGPQEVWVVLEVSATVDRGDVERAQRRQLCYARHATRRWRWPQAQRRPHPCCSPTAGRWLCPNRGRRSFVRRRERGRTTKR
jgi:hypothetical protein